MCKERKKFAILKFDSAIKEIPNFIAKFYHKPTLQSH